MLTYSVIITREDDFQSDEIVLQTYSNEEAAKEHQKFVEENQPIIDYYKWDYVFIRETRVADVFEKDGV